MHGTFTWNKSRYILLGIPVILPGLFVNSKGLMSIVNDILYYKKNTKE